MAKGKVLSVAERKKRLEESAEERRKMFQKVCSHLRAGYSLDCFEELSEVAVKAYMEAFPGEFCPDEYAKALRLGKLGWEQIGRRQADGTCIGNSRSWYYNMSNRYGWTERSQIEADVRNAVSVTVIKYDRKVDSSAAVEAKVSE